jgi:hypothetical protein
MAVAQDKVGGMEERLLGGVERDDEVSSSEKSVKVDMALEEVTTDGADLLKMLERRLRIVNSDKGDTDRGAGEYSALKDAESLTKPVNGDEEDGDGRPDGP